MSKASSIVKTLLGLIIGLAFVGAGVFALLYVLNEEPAAPSEPSGQVEPEPEVDVLEPKSFPEYTWTELGLIADLIEAAPDEASGRAIAQEYGLIDADGHLATSTHLIVIEGGMTVEARLVGILHDTRADGQGRAALTFQVFPIAVRRFNPTASSTGGWQGSELRAWLAQDGMALLPPELSERILPVRKSTDNTGKTDTTSAVTTTDDALWLFSCREVCGEINWLEEEFGYLSDGADAMLNAEGTQYEGFRQAGVDQYSDSDPYLILPFRGEDVPWWYRTPYAFEFLAVTDDTFYQVTATGYASATNLADSEAGVSFGFCL
ncbi:MAG: DUF6273 domain-containing protein [Atopobiaceae bacterium]|nr:DUF6273 domain-containing protein [Atopobiaceae bacterium]